VADKTTATTDFNLDLNTIIEEAFERCGAELRMGYDFRTAKRSLSLLLMDWANRGINLWTLEQGTHTLSYNVGTYDLPVDTVDLLDHVIRTGSGTNQQDINISRISSSTYVSIPNKNAQNDFLRAPPSGCGRFSPGLPGLAALYDARPLAFKPPFGFFPSLRCQAGVLAINHHRRDYG